MIIIYECFVQKIALNIARAVRRGWNIPFYFTQWKISETNWKKCLLHGSDLWLYIVYITCDQSICSVFYYNFWTFSMFYLVLENLQSIIFANSFRGNFLIFVPLYIRWSCNILTLIFWIIFIRSEAKRMNNMGKNNILGLLQPEMKNFVNLGSTKIKQLIYVGLRNVLN